LSSSDELSGCWRCGRLVRRRFDPCSACSL
jgi:hypothetical protein